MDLTWPGLGGGAFQGLGLSSLLVAFVGRRAPRARGLAALVLAFAAGGASQGALLDASARLAPVSSRVITLEAEICGHLEAGAGEGVELCRATEVPSPGLPSDTPRPGSAAWFAPLPVRLLGQYSASDPGAEWLDELRRGDRLRARVRIGPLAGLHNPGGSSSERRWRRQGIAGRVRFLDGGLGARIRSRGAPFTGPGPVSASEALVEGVRRHVAAGLRGDSGLEPMQSEGGGLLAALAVGDRGGIRPSTRAAFARLGIAHLLAISGLHLGLVAGLLFVVSKFVLVWTGDRGRDLRLAALIVAALGAGGYALLAGFGAPVRRALVFVWGGLAAVHLARPISRLHLFCAAWLVVVFIAPYRLFELGTQLSFSATAALLAARSPWLTPPADSPSLGHRWLRGLRSLLHVSALALVATAPWLAARGLGPGAAGLALNLVAIPWMSFVLLPAALLSALAVWADGPASEFILSVARHLAGFTLDLVGVLSNSMPPTAGVRARASGFALVIAGGLALVATRIPETRRVVLVSLASVVWLTTTPPSPMDPRPPRVVMLDVGQGDALLVQGRLGSVLIDGGRSIPGRLDLGQSVVVPALARLGVDFLDAVIVSHGDVDHRGGVPAILEALAVGELWLPWGGLSDPAYRSSIEAARRNGVHVLEIGAEAPPRQLGDVRIVSLWPRPGEVPGSRNAGSLVLRIDLAGRRILMTGDIGRDVETALLESGADLRAEIMKVAHHGSAGSSSAPFLRAVRPRWLLLSAPCGRGGLPHPDALARLAAAGGQLAWTGRDGAVALGLGSDGTSAVPSRRFWQGQARICPEMTASSRSAWRAAHGNP